MSSSSNGWTELVPRRYYTSVEILFECMCVSCISPYHLTTTPEILDLRPLLIVTNKATPPSSFPVPSTWPLGMCFSGAAGSCHQGMLMDWGGGVRGEIYYVSMWVCIHVYMELTCTLDKPEAPLPKFNYLVIGGASFNCSVSI